MKAIFFLILISTNAYAGSVMGYWRARPTVSGDYLRTVVRELKADQIDHTLICRKLSNDEVRKVKLTVRAAVTENSWKILESGKSKVEMFPDGTECSLNSVADSFGWLKILGHGEKLEFGFGIDRSQFKTFVRSESCEKQTVVAPELSDFARNSRGAVRSTDFAEAEDHCRRLKSRLPTVLELALLAQGMGAKGPSEFRRPGDYSIPAENCEGEIFGGFFFSNKDYIKPPGDDGDFAIWSSTAEPLSSGGANMYILEGKNGAIYHVPRKPAYPFAIRCVISR